MSPMPDQTEVATDPRTRALMAEIDDRRSNLPRRTLVAMAMGGLRVRLVRSMVTLVSVVLAIAFLSYMGVSNRLVTELAQTAEMGSSTTATNQQFQESLEISRLLRKNGINASQRLSAGNPMDTWLILMALLTCAVGIANAMLMSVTERFREIGTMKCLGAQDTLVVQLFLFESGLLGLVGAVVGIGLGVVVALLASTLQFKGYGMAYFPWRGAVVVAGWSVVAGIVMAVVAAVYPAVLAARMNPVDALRVDE